MSGELKSIWDDAVMPVMPKASKRRSLDQNDHMWGLLNQIAEQQLHYGNRYSDDDWKQMLMWAWTKETGRKVKLLPSLDGEGVIPILSSRALRVAEMSEFIEFIRAWAAQHGVHFRQDEVTYGTYRERDRPA